MWNRPGLGKVFGWTAARVEGERVLRTSCVVRIGVTSRRSVASMEYIYAINYKPLHVAWTR